MRREAVAAAISRSGVGVAANLLSNTHANVHHAEGKFEESCTCESRGGEATQRLQDQSLLFAAVQPQISPVDGDLHGQRACVSLPPFPLRFLLCSTVHLLPSRVLPPQLLRGGRASFLSLRVLLSFPLHACACLCAHVRPRRGERGQRSSCAVCICVCAQSVHAFYSFDTGMSSFFAQSQSI